MNLEKYFEIMHLTEKLKNNTRHSYKVILKYVQ